ncbi:hypothetical protein D3C71_328670 [compost metagenome]
MTSTILPHSQTLEIGGESITVTEFSFKQLVQAGQLLAQPFSALMGAGKDIPVSTMLTVGGEGVYRVMAMAAGKPYEWTDTLRGEEGVDLLEAVLVVNQEIIKKKLLPLAARASSALAALLKPASS